MIPMWALFLLLIVGMSQPGLAAESVAVSWAATLSAPSIVRLGEEAGLVLRVENGGPSVRLAATVPAANGLRLAAPVAPSADSPLWEILSDPKSIHIPWKPTLRGSIDAAVDLWVPAASTNGAVGWTYAGRRSVPVYVFPSDPLRLGWHIPQGSAASGFIVPFTAALQSSDIAVQLLAGPLSGDTLDLNVLWLDGSASEQGVSAALFSTADLTFAKSFVDRGGALLLTCDIVSGGARCNQLLAAVGAATRVSNSGRVASDATGLVLTSVASAELSPELGTVVLTGAANLVLPARGATVLLQSATTVQSTAAVYGSLEKVGSGRVAVLGGLMSSTTTEYLWNNVAFAEALAGWLAEQAR